MTPRQGARAADTSIPRAPTEAELQELQERARVRTLMDMVPGAVFVFGSNLAGIHGAGAAKDAARLYGAERGTGEGITGRAYALPTRDGHLRTLSLDRVTRAVQTFLRVATATPGTAYVVTRVGCGFAGYCDAQVAPLFRGAPDNVHLPTLWAEWA